MAIKIKTENAAALLTAIRAAASLPNGLPTWSYDATTQRFTHTTAGAQWVGVTLLSQINLQATDGQLKFGIEFPTGAPKDRATYAALHGRFIGMLLSHFHADFSVVWPTNDLTSPDVFTAGQALI